MSTEIPQITTEDGINYVPRPTELSSAIVSNNPYVNNNSSARTAMDASHMTQLVVIDNPEPMVISSGMDYNLADTIMDIKLEGEPDDVLKIIKVISKYKQVMGDNSIPTNPEYYVIYENLRTGVIDVAIVPTYHFQHTSFGFKYVFTKAMLNMRENQIFKAGTILATSPNYDENNHLYMYGVNANVALGSFPGGIEDGFIVSESFAQRMSGKRFGTLAVNYGEEDYLLNLYGDENNYKPFPDIGETIRDDGLVFALRRLDPKTAAVKMTPRALMDVDHLFDHSYYGLAGATVVDITVQHSHDPSTYYIPTGMKDQPSKYFEAHARSQRELEQLYFKLKRERGGHVELSHELHNLVMKSMRDDHNRLKRKNRMTYRKKDIKQFRVVVTYAINYPLQYGSKTATSAGSKGVVTAIWPDDQMPVDKHGTIVDMIYCDNQ